MMKKKNYPYGILIFFLLLLSACDPDSRMVYKPNIYLYPDSLIDIELTLRFPQGGNVVTSIPDYGNGWHVTVDSTGIIDEKYHFLYYESLQPDIWQTSIGWCIETVELENFFKQNLADYGFVEREINDFTEYWLPKFDEHAYYCIYPQTNLLIDDVIQLDFSIQPDRVFRLFYLVEGADKANNSLIEPSVNKFQRNGFYVMEWGVIL